MLMFTMMMMMMIDSGQQARACRQDCGKTKRAIYRQARRLMGAGLIMGYANELVRLCYIYLDASPSLGLAFWLT